MNADELFTDLGEEVQPDNRQMYLSEFTHIAQSYRRNLGPSAEADPAQRQLEQMLVQLADQLGKEVAEFSPKLLVVPLDTQHFSELHVEAPPYLAKLLERYNFYLVNVPITLVPRPGGGFVRLECIVEFNPDRAAAERPIAYQIFPNEEWQQIMHAWQGLSVGLDEKLEFKVDPIQAAAKLATLELPLKAEIEQKTAGQAGLVVGPFDYDIRRAKIVSKGRGNVKVHWRMEGEGCTTQEEPRLGVVLQVPKEIASLDAIGVLVAYSSFHFFTANVGDVISLMSSRGADFFKKGAPITNKMIWQSITDAA